jgi:hypothetical protein
MEKFAELLIGVPRISHPGEEGELVSVLARSWHSDCPGPVEVHVAQLVRDDLDSVWLHVAVIVKYVVGARAHGPLSGGTRDQIKVHPIQQERVHKLFTHIQFISNHQKYILALVSS